ncbi:hypothetical protein DICSQDRAFT_73976 [Dichomitus squalens LYAD-421 SS1]|uniref:Uncharacterized protein n=1 Tax=Dichomitus squalens (strain LYAD-421) TaxID=732165 RepID=R7SHS9_DICSQ|nr:uncharacterized protein DICSQDRAFT_73976 [Dichomitus squalens LYAD-421 SS1]EJF55438.1 hypothetical protein DICSQDRAFT_73976 [Dichomitus squalens LYAD-421 SS1]
MSAHQETHRDRQIWFRVLSGVFFFAPQLYYNRLLKSWVESRVNMERWTLLNQELQVDWSAGILPSTVILTADVGFLAIQSVDQDVSFTFNRSVGQIASYISIIFTIGYIIACSVLERQRSQALYWYGEKTV